MICLCRFKSILISSFMNANWWKNSQKIKNQQFRNPLLNLQCLSNYFTIVILFTIQGQVQQLQLAIKFKIQTFESRYLQTIKGFIQSKNEQDGCRSQFRIFYSHKTTEISSFICKLNHFDLYYSDINLRELQIFTSLCSFCNYTDNIIEMHQINKDKKQTDYNKIHQDHNILLQQLKSFRHDPRQIVPELIQRAQRYRYRDGQYFFFSNIHKKKAVRISDKQDPAYRINQLIEILKHQKLDKIVEVPKLYECASKICQTISKKLPQPFSFKDQTAKVLRSLLDQSKVVQFPNQVFCLVSVSFNEMHDPLLNLLVDDNIPGRQNRSVLLNPAMKYVGLCSMVPLGFEYLKCTVYLATNKVLKKPKFEDTQSPASKTHTINKEQKQYLNFFIQGSHKEKQKSKQMI